MAAARNAGHRLPESGNDEEKAIGGVNSDLVQRRGEGQEKIFSVPLREKYHRIIIYPT